MKAANLGSQIAAAMSVDLVLLHVVRQEKASNAIHEFAKTEQFPGSEIEKIMQSAQAILEGIADKARSAGVKSAQVEVEKGPVARTIIATAERTDSDMIVIGSRGMGDLEGLLRGGVSHRVETLAKCPVLVVK